jgi:putative transposase
LLKPKRTNELLMSAAKIQVCIIHMVRNSLKYVNWKDRKILAADLKTIYGAKILGEAGLALNNFAEKWDSKYSSISQS